jgi:hypothetical protein
MRIGGGKMALRWYLKLTEPEALAIGTLADRELRQPGDEARLLLREALIQRGLLAPDEGLFDPIRLDTDEDMNKEGVDDAA